MAISTLATRPLSQLAQKLSKERVKDRAQWDAICQRFIEIELTPRDVSMVMTSLAAVRHIDENAIQTGAQFCAQKMKNWDFSTRNLTEIAWAFSHFGTHFKRADEIFQKHIGPKMATNIRRQRFEERNIVSLVSSYARARQKLPQVLIDALLQEARPLPDNLVAPLIEAGAHELVLSLFPRTALQSASAWKSVGRNVEGLTDEFLNMFCETPIPLTACDAEKLSDYAWSCRMLRRYVPKETIDDVLKATAECNLSPAQLTSISSSACVLKRPFPFERFHSAIHQLDPPQLVQVCWAFATSGNTKDEELKLLLRQRLEELLPLAECTDKMLANFAVSLTALGAKPHGDLYNILLEKTEKMQKLGAPEASAVCVSLAKGKAIDNALFIKLADDFADGISKASSQAYGNMAWALETADLEHRLPIPASLKGPTLDKIHLCNGLYKVPDAAHLMEQLREEITHPLLNLLREVEKTGNIKKFEAFVIEKDIPHLGRAFTREVLDALGYCADKGIRRAEASPVGAHVSSSRASTSSVWSHVWWQDESPKQKTTRQEMVVLRGYREDVRLKPVFSQFHRDKHSERLALLEVLDDIGGRRDVEVGLWVSLHPCVSCLAILAQFRRHIDGPLWVDFAS